MAGWRIGVCCIALAMPSVACAADHSILMKTNGPSGLMVFEPAFVHAQIGDTLHFIPFHPGHNAETIPGILPAGASPIAGFPGQAVTYRLAKAGLYGVECRPHFGMGMIALIKVGNGTPPNAAAPYAVKLPPLAARRMAPLLAAARK